MEMMESVQSNVDFFEALQSFIAGAGLRLSGNRLLRAVVDVDLNEVYLKHAPAEQRQSLTCSCCKDFLRNAGTYIEVLPDGRRRSAIWGGLTEDHEHYETIAPVVQELERIVLQSKNIKTIRSRGEQHSGAASKGGWPHFYTAWPTTLPDFRSNVKFRQRRETIGRNIEKYYIHSDLLEKAETLFDLSNFYCNRSIAEQLKAHQEMAEFIMSGEGELRLGRILYLAGLDDNRPIQLNNTMLAFLLDGLLEGRHLDSLRKTWNELIGPQRYRRPTATADEGEIDRAEKIIAELNLASALRRRAARLDEVIDRATWRASGNVEEETKTTGTVGVFNALRHKPAVEEKPTTAPGKVVSWTVFERDVLPKAEKLYVDVSSGLFGYGGLITAVNADAEPLMKWDSREERNPFSQYIMSSHIGPNDIGFSTGELEQRGELEEFRRRGGLVQIDAVMNLPSQWSGDDTYEGRFIAIRNARPVRGTKIGLFPRMLRHELHAIRRVIENYSNNTELTGVEEGVSGLFIFKDAEVNITVHVERGGMIVAHTIDRWE